MADEQHGSRARPVQRPSNTGALGLVLILVAVAVALGLYFATAENQVNAEKEQPAAEPVSPFADMPPEQPKSRKPKAE